VQGEAYRIGDRTLIPVAKIVSFGKAKGTVGTNQIEGWGGGFVRITPLSILEETAEGQRCIPITDMTATALRRQVGAAVAIILFFTVVQGLVRRWRRTRAED
jgi:uncharacterized spore protein YtfJ